MNHRIFICTLLLAGLICLPCTGVTALSGRVYDGLTLDESVPVPGITISCYCSQQAQDPAKMISWGTLIGQSVTDPAGYWEIPVLQACPYYVLIRSSAAAPMINEGATSVGGTVIDPEMIEYAGPLPGRTLTGNKFWYRTERFSGRVYEGAPGDESTPVAGIDISCHCAGGPVNPDPALPLPAGSITGQTQTDPAGYWEITPVSGCSPYYLILLELPPAFPLSPNGATSAGGDAVRPTVIQYGNPSGIEPLQGKVLTGNKFWLTSATVPGSTPAQTPASPSPSNIPAPATPLPGTQQFTPSDPGTGPEAAPVIPVDTPPEGEPESQGGVPPEEVVITGQVFRQVPGAGEEPLTGAPVEIFCSEAPGSPGIPSGAVETDAGGSYNFRMPGGCRYYILVAHPADEVILASSPTGVVVDGNRIVIPAPVPGSPAEANNFVLSASMPGPERNETAIPGISLLTWGVLTAGAAVLIIFLGILWKKQKDE
jgi:hypothetical protein